jgi:hypothetical protein
LLPRLSGGTLQSSTRCSSEALSLSRSFSVSASLGGAAGVAGRSAASAAAARARQRPDAHRRALSRRSAP